MKRASILLLALVAICSVQSAKAWGTFGHGVIAYIAEQHLTPTAKEEVRRYTKHTLPWYSSWMDHWRAVPPFHPTDNWHGFSATADGNVNWEKSNGKAMGEIKRLMEVMGDGKYKDMPDSLVRHNIIILVHALPDMHCPVHVGFSKKDFPEYRYNLRSKGKTTSLHGFWDNSPAYTRKGWSYEKYTSVVDKVSPKEVKKFVKKGNYTHWGRDIIAQAHRAYQITPEDKEITKLTAEEKKMVLGLTDEMVLKSAYRLAYVLNTIFDCKK